MNQKDSGENQLSSNLRHYSGRPVPSATKANRTNLNTGNRSANRDSNP